MADAFTIDRSDLPKPWANPLIFTLRSGDLSISAQVKQAAAIEYQSAWRGGNLALALAAQRTEYFVRSVEEAVNRIVQNQPASPTSLMLDWDDINP
jgi:hypothetical protein